ncbi:MAG: pyridine nucleotide-disulfide oxidoreductase [Alphaproteobacteria bacterium]|nr:MAG: pyridine nucleotide-disulfide oxidoreductase [Alphaproteobacteria bacterium]
MTADTQPEVIVIVGAGHGAGQCAASLRQEGFEGKIVLIGEEPYLPYQRPPLSKKFLSGELTIERVYFKPADFYETAEVDVRLNTRVTEIDRGAKEVVTEDGTRIAYDKLILTTGSRVRELRAPGADLKGIHYLRTIDDVEGLKTDFTAGKHMVIVGAGYVGLEVAAVALKHGLEVTVLEMEPRVLARVTSPEVSQFFHDVHTEAGVNILYGHAVTEFKGEDRLQEAVLSNGSTLRADIALIGIGILPNMELAEAAGIACHNGIQVDELCRTSDPDVFAAGDCTEHPNPIYGRRIRLESVHNALEQAKTAAAAALGKEKPYAQVPWFWSDQYDLKLQMAGLNQGYDEVVLRGDPTSRKFAAFYLKDGVLIAVDAINAAPEYMIGRKLIGEKAKVAPARLRDINVNMKEVAAG